MADKRRVGVIGRTDKGGYGHGIDTVWKHIPDCEVVDLDAGCCGMAGSFGYEREHYELSQTVGQRKLFPSVQDASGDVLIIASGFSFRHQIEHFTARKAVHPAVALGALFHGNV